MSEEKKELLGKDFFDEDEKEIENGDENIFTEPFNPNDIDIVMEQHSMSYLIDKLKHSEIDLNTDFQRSPDLWKQDVMSRFIESLIIKFPIPAFFFETSNPKKWQVIDGLQRLSTLQAFMFEKRVRNYKGKYIPFQLKGLEFLKNLEGKMFDELDAGIQRNISTAQITIHVVRKGTPKDVKYRIFERLNTGGLRLNPQEIRHALNQGIASKFLSDLAVEQVVEQIIPINDRRMERRELILRYLAFKINGTYKPSLKTYLDKAMEKIGILSIEEREILKNGYIKTLETAKEIFGNEVFQRKNETEIKIGKTFHEIFRREKIKVNSFNKSLYEVWTVVLSELGEEKIKELIANKDILKEKFKKILEDKDFISSIQSSTTSTKHVNFRFEKIRNLVDNYKINNETISINNKITEKNDFKN